MSPGQGGGAITSECSPGQHRASSGARQPGRCRHHTSPPFPMAFPQCFRGFRAFRARGGSGYAPPGNRHRAVRKRKGSDPPGEHIQVLPKPSVSVPAHAIKPRYRAKLKRWPPPRICHCVDPLSHEGVSASHPSRAWCMTSDERSEEQGIENGRSLATTGRRPGEVEGAGLGSKGLSRHSGRAPQMSDRHQLVIEHVDAGSEGLRLRSRGRGGAGHPGLQGLPTPHRTPMQIIRNYGSAIISVSWPTQRPEAQT